MVLALLALDIPVINLSWLPKIFATTILTRNSWLFDSTADICVCNQRELFIEFVESPTALSEVIFASIFSG